MMERSVISRGTTVSTAVTTALDLLDASREQVSIEVLEPERKSLWGKSKPAVVRVTLKAEEPSPEEPMTNVISDSAEATAAFEAIPTNPLPRMTGDDRDSSLESHPGKAWVRDGILRTRNAPDKYPLVTPCEGVLLYVNSVMRTTTTPIGEMDVVVVEFESDPAVEPEWEVRVDERRMRATLRVKPGYGLQRVLEDAEPSDHLKLRVRETRQYRPIDPAAIEAHLREQGIVHGVVHAAIEAACRSEVETEIAVATGEEPSLGTNGTYTMVWEADNPMEAPRIREDGTVDYRETRHFPSVAQGQLLAVVLPPVPGKPGKTIFGEPVEPPPVFELTLAIGNGVAYLDTERKLVALQSGTPLFQRKGQLLKASIAPKLLHPRDVDLNSGNLHYQGDIEVLGSVQDGMSVEASGNVTVHGNVNMGHVVAARSIVVSKNIIGSRISAAMGGAIYGEAAPYLSETLRQLLQFRSAIAQVTAAAAFKSADIGRAGLAPLVKVLMQGKFKSLREPIIRLCQTIEAHRADLDERWTAYGSRLAKAFLASDGAGLQDVNDLDRLAAMTNELVLECEAAEIRDGFLKFYYAHNGSVKCGGDVTVFTGCYNVSLTCLGSLEVTGFLKGGDYYARNGAKVREAGAQGGASTRIRVDAAASIRIRTVYDNTFVQVGSVSYKFTQDMSDVHIRLDSDGKLLIH